MVRNTPTYQSYSGAADLINRLTPPSNADYVSSSHFFQILLQVERRRKKMTCSGLSSRFGMLGALVGKFPWYSMGTSLIIMVISITGLYFRMSLKVALDDGFVTWNAPSRKEITSQKQFFGAEGDSWYLALFGLPKRPNGNMLSSKEYYELDGFYKNITENLRLTVNTSETEQISYRYMDICEPLCNINDQLQKIMENSWIVDMKYPVSRVLSYDVNIGKHVFKRATVNSTGELTGSELVAFYFTVFVTDDLRKKQVTHFEDEVFRLTAEHNSNPNALVEIISHGSNSVSREMERGIMEIPYIGHSSAAFLLLVINGISGWLNGQFPLGRLTLGLVTLCVMISAMAGSLGFISLMGLSINLLFFTSPFVTLVLVISAYNTFHIMDAWSRLSTEAIRKQFTQSERLAATFEQIAPSYLPTNLSLIIGFFIAHFFLIHNYAVFSLATALALLLNFLYEIFFFSALLCLACQHSKKAYENHFLNGKAHHKPSISNYPPSMSNISQNGIIKSNGTQKRLTIVQSTKAQRREFRLSFAKRIFVPYVKFLSSGFTKLAMLMIFVAVGWFGAGRGLQSLDNRMDYRKMLPNGSPSIRPFDLMDTIWMDILQIVYIVKKPPNFENATEFAEFRTFVAEASSIPQAMAPRAHMSWIFDYYRDQLNQDFFRLPKQGMLGKVILVKNRMLFDPPKQES
ncbi:patched family domain-containing protein [Ditylenchus destructor]|uniref:Patched family domain-containing protein n=1 Tax=Ditylenchus destructor TaxID=166010 RepID=A0AAD4NCB2_9BILA|nr:patched family domain-containing protein [Ditylenchus destructor]